MRFNSPSRAAITAPCGAQVYTDRGDRGARALPAAFTVPPRHTQGFQQSDLNTTISLNDIQKDKGERF